jgi:hypothetical protein
MGEYSLKRYHRFVLSALLIYLLPFTTLSKHDRSVFNITFHHRSDAIDKASYKANLFTEVFEHSYEHFNTTSRFNLYNYRPSLTAFGYS